MMHPREERLLDLALGDAADSELQIHVSECASCSERLLELEVEQARLCSFFAREENTAELEARILERIDRESQARTRGKERKTMTRWLLAAAAFILALGLAWSYRPHRTIVEHTSESPLDGDPIADASSGSSPSSTSTSPERPEEALDGTTTSSEDETIETASPEGSREAPDKESRAPAIQLFTGQELRGRIEEEGTELLQADHLMRDRIEMLDEVISNRDFFLERAEAAPPGMRSDKGRRLEKDGALAMAGEFSSLAAPDVLVEKASQSEQKDGTQSSEGYDRISENSFQSPLIEPLSTFCIDVDRASYANVRRYLRQGSLPPADAVRIEELLNSFSYRLAPPPADAVHPVNIAVEAAGCPWESRDRLVRISLRAKDGELEKRPRANLVFLLDVSGSMRGSNKLPLLKQSLIKLVDGLKEDDRVAICVYAGAARLVLASTSCAEREKILNAIYALRAGGSTAGGDGIKIAYRTARENFVEGGINRVVLGTDGDFNVGITDRAELKTLIERNARSGVYLTILGYGMGNLKDGVMEELSNVGDGNYAYIDSLAEAEKVLGREMLGTIWTLAKDVKLQVDFNPAQVGAYRLIGYENRALAARDFSDDTKDAGDMGAGHSVTALYQIVPAGAELPLSITPSRYATRGAGDAPESKELLTVRLRYKNPGASEGTTFEVPFEDGGKHLDQASDDFKFAAAVAAFGLALRKSQYGKNINWGTVRELAREGLDFDPHGERAEFLELVDLAEKLDR